MVPEYLNFVLTGKMANEYTNATTGNLVNARAKDWDWEVIDRLGLPRRIFGKLEMPGTALGGLTSAVQAEVGFDAQVVLPATHDTGSAFLAVPARDDQAVYISSGTWSLLGVENAEPHFERHVVPPRRGERRADHHARGEGRELHERGRRVVPLPLPQEHHGALDDPVHTPRAQRR